MKENNSLKEILFASTMFPRYLSRFWLGIISCYNFNRYIDLQFQFTNKLNEDNNWIDQKVDTKNNIKLENAILNKAKKIRLSQS